MKKLVFLTLTLVMCLSLWGCGGLKGEKAAELYPDIIGNWGTDPFGEEIALSLSSDGSCTILENPGTWTLDAKQSSETHVTLTAKTKNVTYSIYLERVPADTNNTFQTVHLSINDSKKKLVVYENDVFTPEGNILSHEHAMQTIPEVVGEWGNIFWFEESVLTLQEDGTCILNRQPGRWCVRSDGADWPKVTILIKLDSGKHYRAELQLSAEVHGFNVAYLEIYDADNNTIFYPADSETAVYDSSVIKRNIIPSHTEVLPEILGTWATKNDPSTPIATFREDGSCTVLNGSGVWGISYTSYYRDLQNYGEVIIWEVGLKISGESYTLYFVPYEDNRFDMTIYGPGPGMTILPRNDTIKISEN